MGARDGAPGGLRGVVRGEDDAVRAGANPGEIVLRNQTTWKNNVNLAQTEACADRGPAATLRSLGRLRREHCRALRLRDEPVPEQRQLEHAAAEPASRTTLYRQASACSSSRSCRAATSSCTRRASCVFMRFVPFTCVPLLTLCIHKCSKMNKLCPMDAPCQSNIDSALLDLSVLYLPEPESGKTTPVDSGSLQSLTPPHQKRKGALPWQKKLGLGTASYMRICRYMEIYGESCF